MNNNLLIGAAALLLGGAGGFVIGQGKRSGVSDAEVAVRAAESKASRFSSGAGTKSGAATKSRVAGGMSFREIMNEPGQTRRVQALMDYYASLGPDDFEEAVEKLNDLPFGERILAGTLLFSRWAEVAPEEAMAAAQAMGREGFFARPAVMRSWASSDPRAAANFYEENEDEFGGTGGRRGPGGDPAGQIAREWAKQDPQAALAWAQGLEGEAGNDAVGDIFSQISIDDPARAAQMAATLTGEQQAEAYQSIAREWSRKDFGAAEQWINSLPSDQRDVAMAEAIRGLSDSDPALAAGKVASLSDQEAIADAVRSVARNWAEDDPAATAQWLVQQDTEELGRPMYETMRSWSSQDPLAALEFVNGQPEGELRDTALSSYLMVNRDGDPQESLSLAATISDDESRARTMGMAVRRWAAEDEAAATQYVQSLPEVQQTQIAEWAANADRGRGGWDGGDFRGRGR